MADKRALIIGVTGQDGAYLGEIGLDRHSGNPLIATDPRHFRPTEVDFLLGNPEKTHRKPNRRHSHHHAGGGAK